MSHITLSRKRARPASDCRHVTLSPQSRKIVDQAPADGDGDGAARARLVWPGSARSLVDCSLSSLARIRNRNGIHTHTHILELLCAPCLPLSLSRPWHTRSAKPTQLECQRALSRTRRTLAHSPARMQMCVGSLSDYPRISRTLNNTSTTAITRRRRPDSLTWITQPNVADGNGTGATNYNKPETRCLFTYARHFSTAIRAQHRTEPIFGVSTHTNTLT